MILVEIVVEIVAPKGLSSRSDCAHLARAHVTNPPTQQPYLGPP